ncbi:MAG TPA: PAS domain-containing protein [Phycisphaerae bacterium]|nr:PAS domain-containing protein [Phycisphaerae bacterium]
MTRTRWATAVRLSIGLTGVTVSLVFAAALLGLAPGIGLAVFLALTGLAGYTAFLLVALWPFDPAASVPERVRAALDNLSEGLVLLDEGLHIVFANAAFAEILGTPAEGLEGRDLSEFSWRHVHSGEHRVEWPWETVFREGVARRGATLGLTTPSEGERVVVLNAAPIAQTDDRPRGVLVTCRDVTAAEWIDLTLEEAHVEGDARQEARREPAEAVC